MSFKAEVLKNGVFPEPDISIFPNKETYNRELQFIKELLDSDGTYCKFNITKDLIIDTPIQTINGVIYRISTPDNFNFTDCINACSKKLEKEDKSEILDFNSIDNLLSNFEKGNHVLEHIYKSKITNEDFVIAKQRIFMYRDNETNDIIGISYIIDKTLVYRVNTYNSSSNSETGHFNKCINKEQLRQTVEEYLKQENVCGSFILIDLDNFKKINNLGGQTISDTFLTNTANTIYSVFGDDGIISYFNDDNFVVFLPNICDEVYIREKIEILMHDSYKEVENDSKKFATTLSVGISIFPKDATDFIKLYQKADRALYLSKALGRNRYSFYRDIKKNFSFNNNPNLINFNFTNEPDSNCKDIIDSLQTVGLFVITESDHKILYFNRKFKEIMPNIQLGMTCEDIWNNNCDSCPLHIIGEEAMASTISYNNPFGPEVEITATRMFWNKQIPAFIIRVSPHTDYCPANKASENIVITGQAKCLYTIDEDFNIISYSVFSKQLNNDFEIGQKCYSCILGRTEPCENCPRYSEQYTSIPTSTEAKPYVTRCIPIIQEDKSKAYTIAIYDIVYDKKTDFNKNAKSFANLNSNQTRDDITGGYNRTGFIHMVENLRQNNLDLTEYAVVYINIKNFKAINDLFGFEAGDNLLRTLYTIIYTSTLRPKVAARIESDHFVFFIKRSYLNLERLNKIINFTWKYKNQFYFVHCECGIFYVDNADLQISGMIDRAKLANEYVHDGNTNAYAIFNSSMAQDYIERAEVLALFEKAITKKEFKVFYQPIVSAKTGKICSAEALTRWYDGKNRVISPAAFIPVLEEHGHITKLDTYVIGNVCHFLKDRNDNGKPIIPISINLSRIDFLDESLINQITTAAKKNTNFRDYIRYEITETAYASLEQHQSEFIKTLRECGKKIILDDFGSGYSSFGMIQDFDFDILKIDMSFIRQIEKNIKVRTIIETIISMCHNLNIEVVAEGVETKEELEFLKEKDCDYIQGYYFSKPLSQEEFDEYLKNNL